MKRLFLAVLALCLTLAFAAPAVENAVYTNLADDKSMEDIKALLLSKGIDAAEADAFVDCAARTAEAFEGMGLAGAAWRPLSEAEVDAYAFQEKWDERFPDFLGYNCRITAFTLLKKHIQVKERAKEASSLLVFDLAAIDSAPGKLFTADELAAFQTLFAPIPTGKTADSAEHVKEIQAAYQQRGILFQDRPKLITVYLHDEDLDNPGQYCLFPGHAGVLIEDGNELYFVEKLAFQTPYQVTRFADRTQLIEYLQTSYASFHTEGLSAPILMENDQPLQ